MTGHGVASGLDFWNRTHTCATHDRNTAVWPTPMSHPIPRVHKNILKHSVYSEYFYFLRGQALHILQSSMNTVSPPLNLRDWLLWWDQRNARTSEVLPFSHFRPPEFGNKPQNPWLLLKLPDLFSEIGAKASMVVSHQENMKLLKCT